MLSNFIIEKEKELVKEVFENAIDVLNDEDKKLPQVRFLHFLLIILIYLLFFRLNIFYHF